MPAKRNVILSVLTRVAVCVVLLAVGIGVLLLLVETRTPPASAPKDDDWPRVAVLQVQSVPVRRQFEGFGTAEAFRAVDVPAQVRGVVEQLPEKIVAGNRVERGELLARLDDSDYQREVEIRTQQLADIDAQVRRLDVELAAAISRLELVQEEVELAEADLQRVLRAQETAGATQREVDQQRQVLAASRREQVAAEEALEQIEPRRSQLQAARAQAESSLRLAQRNLERTTITSPIDGVLQRVDVNLGESVAIDQAIARVVDLTRIDVPVRLPASARSHLAAGSEVTLSPAAREDAQWTAQIARIAPENEEQSRTVTVYVEFRQDPAADEGKPLLSPGQFVRAQVHGVDETVRHVIPRRALAADRIRLIEDGTVRSRRVEVAFEFRRSIPELGVGDDHWLALREPLDDDALVVLDANRRLADGARVQPVIANPTARGESDQQAAAHDGPRDTEATP